MKNLTVSLLATALLLSCSVSAQTRFGIKAGLDMASMPLSDDYFNVLEFVEGADFENKSLPAFHAGAVIEFGLGSNFGLGTGVQLRVKGGKREFSGVVLNVPYTRTKSVRLLYLQMPLMLQYRNSGFYAGLGPYLGYAVGGSQKTKTESGGDSSSSSESLDFGSDENDDYGKFDFGGAVELGYELFGNLRLSASYSLGLANVIPADQVEAADDLGGNWSGKNNVIGLSVTYLFGGNE